MDGTTLGSFLTNVPPILTSALVNLATYIAAIRWCLEAISWKASYYDAFLCLAGWWGACLFADHGIRYLLPLPAMYLLSRRKRTTTIPAATEQSLQKTISDLSVIKSLLPSVPTLPTLSIPQLARITASIYIPYLILTYLARLRLLVAVAGTIVLTWRAPWATLIRAVLSRNTVLQRLFALAWFRLTGMEYSPQLAALSMPDTAVSRSRFVFTVLENQRWWVGLDWTAALLPNERPSWCSSSLHPVSPPAAFTLPEATTSVLRDGKGRIVKTKTTWKWEENDEWSVLVKKDANSLQTRAQKPIPRDDLNATVSSSMMSKVAAKMKEHPMSPTVSADHHNSLDAVSAEDDEDGESDPVTDTDGWVYGDNKWENQTSKGGYNKYTRYRRWTRIAVAEQTTVVVEGSSAETGVYRDTNNRISQPKESAADMLQKLHTRSSADSYDCVDDINSSPRGVRQRLKTSSSNPARVS